MLVALGQQLSELVHVPPLLVVLNFTAPPPLAVESESVDALVEELPLSASTAGAGVAACEAVKITEPSMPNAIAKLSTPLLPPLKRFSDLPTIAVSLAIFIFIIACRAGGR